MYTPLLAFCLTLAVSASPVADPAVTPLARGNYIPNYRRQAASPSALCVNLPGAKGCVAGTGSPALPALSSAFSSGVAKATTTAPLMVPNPLATLASGVSSGVGSLVSGLGLSNATSGLSALATGAYSGLSSLANGQLPTPTGLPKLSGLPIPTGLPKLSGLPTPAGLPALTGLPKLGGLPKAVSPPVVPVPTGGSLAGGVLPTAKLPVPTSAMSGMAGMSGMGGMAGMTGMRFRQF